VNYPSLPAGGNVSGNELPEFTSDFTAYLANTTASINTRALESFIQNLTLVDAMLNSQEIK